MLDCSSTKTGVSGELACHGFARFFDKCKTAKAQQNWKKVGMAMQGMLQRCIGSGSGDGR